MLKPPDSTSEIAAMLQPKERILWTGRPYDGVVFQWRDAPFTGLAVFLVCPLVLGGVEAAVNGKLQMPTWPGFLFLSCFLLVLCYLGFGRLFVNAWLRSKYLYAVTNERAITISGVRTRAVRSVYLAKMAETILIERDNGWGTIILGAVFPWERFYGRDRAASDFEHLEGVRGVDDILSEARRTAKERREH